MREQAVMILVGALAGLFPTLLTTIITWLDKRGLVAKQNRALSLAKQRVEFLDTWVKAQEALCSPERFDEIKREVSDELFQINRTLRESLVEEEEQFVKLEERNVLQRLFLLYTPRSATGWVFHVLFYMFLGILVVSLVSGWGWGMGERGWSLGYLIGEWAVLSPFIVLMLLFRWFATRSEREVERRMEAQ